MMNQLTKIKLGKTFYSHVNLGPLRSRDLAIQLDWAFDDVESEDQDTPEKVITLVKKFFTKTAKLEVDAFLLSMNGPGGGNPEVLVVFSNLSLIQALECMSKYHGFSKPQWKNIEELMDGMGSINRETIQAVKEIKFAK
jgi:hypothetical protein